MNSFEIGEFKLTLIRKLIGNADIVKLLDPTGALEYTDDLIYKNVFPYNRVPECVYREITVTVLTCSAPRLTRSSTRVMTLGLAT